MYADDFRDFMLAFLFLRYRSENYEDTARRELGTDYPRFAECDTRVPLAVWYAEMPVVVGCPGAIAELGATDHYADA